MITDQERKLLGQVAAMPKSVMTRAQCRDEESAISLTQKGLMSLSTIHVKDDEGGFDYDEYAVTEEGFMALANGNQALARLIKDRLATPFSSMSPVVAYCVECKCPEGHMHVTHSGRGAPYQQGWKPCEECGAALGEPHTGVCGDVRATIRRSH